MDVDSVRYAPPHDAGLNDSLMPASLLLPLAMLDSIRVPSATRLLVGLTYILRLRDTQRAMQSAQAANAGNLIQGCHHRAKLSLRRAVRPGAYQLDLA